MKDKVVSARNAVELIQPYDTVFTSGFVGTGTPEALIRALEQRYLRTETPSDIMLIFAAAPGDGASRASTGWRIRDLSGASSADTGDWCQNSARSHSKIASKPTICRLA